MIKSVIFDFGGVIAEEGFREGLKAIGTKKGLNPDRFYSIASELVYQTGYVIGLASEAEYWHAVRKAAAIDGSDQELRTEILERFVLRPEMTEIVRRIKLLPLTTAILSDQTNWLNEINRKNQFFPLFDYIFNSYIMHKGKRDLTLFSDVCKILRTDPDEALFIDDNRGNIERAGKTGLNTILFTGFGDFKKEMAKFF